MDWERSRRERRKRGEGRKVKETVHIRNSQHNSALTLTRLVCTLITLIEVS